MTRAPSPGQPRGRRFAGARCPVALLVATLLFAACGSDSSVGEGVDLNVADQAKRAALEDTTTTAPPRARGDDAAKAAVGGTTTTAPTTTTTEPPLAIAISIAINSDTGGSTQFEPSAVRVFVGSLVEWVNRDTVARSVVADNGAFDSGPIAPGGNFVYEADTVGEFNYSDGTRPYAVGVLEVLPRG